MKTIKIVITTILSSMIIGLCIMSMSYGKIYHSVQKGIDDCVIQYIDNYQENKDTKGGLFKMIYKETGKIEYHIEDDSTFTYSSLIKMIGSENDDNEITVEMIGKADGLIIQIGDIGEGSFIKNLNSQVQILVFYYKYKILSQQN